MFRKYDAACIILAAGLLLGSGCGQASGGRKELETAGTRENAEAISEIRDGNEEESGHNSQEPDLEGDTQKEEEDAKEDERDGNDDGSALSPLTQENGKTVDMRAEFGEACIGDQTFQAELSQYDGKVWFVPFAPEQGNPDFRIELIQNGNVLEQLTSYVPEGLNGESFVSLDAVSFYDINFDGNTDILLIETYGNTTFAAVYYGFDRDGEDYERHFSLQQHLSEQISGKTGEMSVPGIRKALGDTRKNGTFSSYQQAYEAVSRFLDVCDETAAYDLIYVDEDEVPELAAGVDGYYASLYTYSQGKVYMLMDRWAYGAMGNAGYEYAPKKNNLRNYNSDYAGAVVYTTYMSVNRQHALDTEAEIKTVNFDDVNGNGILDEEEMGSVGYYGVSYLYGKQASYEECAVYDAGEYEMIRGTMSLEELIKELGAGS